MDNFVLNKLRSSLFKDHLLTASALEPCDNVTGYKNIYMAVTVNPDPFMLMNKKKYSTYSHEKQVDILSRVEKSLRTKHPDIKLIEIQFEECPNLKQMHFHALYSTPVFMGNEMDSFWKEKICRKNSPSWTYIVTDEVYDKKGWLEYIRKGMHKK